MIKIGKILIDPNSIDTILKDFKSSPNREKDVFNVQIIYKSGVVKNIPSCDLGMSYDEFIDKFIKYSKQAEDTKILRIMAAINQQKANELI